MIYALVHYPSVESPRINQVREKYDPQVDLIAPHITLMFPVPESVGEDILVRHLERVLCNWQPFLIHLQGVQISLDDHLFLMLQEGNANVIRLHDEIYTGILVEYRREDIPFIPHVTLGVFEENSSNHERVLEEAKQLGIDQSCMLDKLHLVKVNDDRSRIVWNKEFSLAE
jgi:2'-5' RNA ligase